MATGMGRSNRTAFFIGIVAFALLISSAVAAAVASPAVHAQASLSGNEKIGEGVFEALQEEGEARVVIALVETPTSVEQRGDLNRVANQVSVIQAAALSSVDSTEFSLSHRYRTVPALAGTLTTTDGLIRLAANPSVTKIDLDVGGTGTLAVSVPLIGADSWASAGNLGDGVVVAVLDSGMDTDHSDLAPALIHQACFLDNNGAIDGFGLCPNGSDRQIGPGAAEDDAGHGTHVSGIIASRGNQSSAGVAPGADIVSIKVTAGPSYSGIFYSFAEIVAALDYVAISRPDVQIINMSLGTNDQFVGDCDNTFAYTMAGAAAINNLRALGVTAFASAGNNGSGATMSAPACLSNVISVGATDNSDVMAGFSDSNASTDLVAPGVGIVSSDIGNTTFTASGTSMASPHAAGCAVLLTAAGEAVTPDEIEARLETSPVQIFNPKNGLTFPRLDCRLKSLSSVEVSGPADGSVNQSLPFTATVTPSTATQPISYVWQATDQIEVTSTAGLTDTVSFTWNTPGVKTISVTAENAAGSVTDIYTTTIRGIGLDRVEITGPATGYTGAAYAFVATSGPINASLPISYRWAVTDLPEVIVTDYLSNTATFTWAIGGTKLISVTAQNSVNQTTATYSIEITESVSITAVAISGPEEGETDTEYAFTAQVSPANATPPFAYVWSPAPDRGQGTASAVYSWAAAGNQQIRLTASNINGGASASDTLPIDISESKDDRLFLPLIISSHASSSSR